MDNSVPLHASQPSFTPAFSSGGDWPVVTPTPEALALSLLLPPRESPPDGVFDLRVSMTHSLLQSDFPLPSFPLEMDIPATVSPASSAIFALISEITSLYPTPSAAFDSMLNTMLGLHAAFTSFLVDVGLFAHCLLTPGPTDFSGNLRISPGVAPSASAVYSVARRKRSELFFQAALQFTTFYNRVLALHSRLGLTGEDFSGWRTVICLTPAEARACADSDSNSDSEEDSDLDQPRNKTVKKGARSVEPLEIPGRRSPEDMATVLDDLVCAKKRGLPESHPPLQHHHSHSHRRQRCAEYLRTFVASREPSVQTLVPLLLVQSTTLMTLARSILQSLREPDTPYLTIIETVISMAKTSVRQAQGALEGYIHRTGAASPPPGHFPFSAAVQEELCCHPAFQVDHPAVSDYFDSLLTAAQSFCPFQ